MGNKQRARVVMMQELRAEAVRLYCSGLTLREVAANLDRPATTRLDEDGVTDVPALTVSHMWVKRTVDRELDRLAAESADTVDRWRQRELIKLEEMERSLAVRATAGDDDAVRSTVLIMRQRERYLPGLANPIQVEHTAKETLAPAVVSRLEQAKMRVAEQERRLQLEAASTAVDDVVDAELVE